MSKPNKSKTGALSVEDHVGGRDLVAARLDGQASPAQIAELSDLIANRPDVRDYYVAQSVLVTQLTVFASADQQVERNQRREPVVSNTAAWMRPLSLVLMTSAALALIVVALFLNRDPSPIESTADAANRIGQMRLVSLETPAKPVLPGKTVSLEQGDCVINLENGVEFDDLLAATLCLTTPCFAG